MADKGIIFSAPMVRALLAGSKTQTRRLFKPHGFTFYTHPISGDRYDQHNLDGLVGSGPMQAFGWGEGLYSYLPYAPGDRLYVREAWHAARSLDRTPPRDIPRDADIEHAATARSYAEIGLKGKLRPGMFLPRWASRLWLGVTEVRVQRLQGISEADCIAEGIDGPAIEHFRNPVNAYAALWNSLHGSDNDQSWEANPWIVGVSFTVHPGNIDA